MSRRAQVERRGVSIGCPQITALPKTTPPPCGSRWWAAPGRRLVELHKWPPKRPLERLLPKFLQLETQHAISPKTTLVPAPQRQIITGFQLSAALQMFLDVIRWFKISH